jgi:tetratricopeptide (TPR) repeat protein
LQTSSNFFNSQTLLITLLIPFHIYIVLSYPLQLPVFLFLFIFLNIYLSIVTDYKHLLSRSHFKFIFFGILVLLFYNIIYQLKKSKTFNDEMNEIQKSNSIGYTKEALKMSIKLRKDNPKMYESNYLLGNCFYQSNKIDTSIIHLENNHIFTCSYEYHLLLGKCYEQKNNLKKAILNYKNALFIIPHKFETRYQLMNLYYKNSIIDSALYYANEILTFPIKINSSLQQYYNNEASKLLNSKNK